MTQNLLIRGLLNFLALTWDFLEFFSASLWLFSVYHHMPIVNEKFRESRNEIQQTNHSDSQCNGVALPTRSCCMSMNSFIHRITIVIASAGSWLVGSFV